MILIYVYFYGAYLILFFVLSRGHEAYFRYIQRKYKINYRDPNGIAYVFFSSKKIIELAIEEYKDQEAEPVLRRILRNNHYIVILRRNDIGDVYLGNNNFS